MRSGFLVDRLFIRSGFLLDRLFIRSVFFGGFVCLVGWLVGWLIDCP